MNYNILMEIKIFTDGGSINNPGPSASAFIVYADNRLLFNHSEKIGINTNNYAEYNALFLSLNYVKNRTDIKATKISVFSDSNLMVSQLNGLFKVKNTAIRNFIVKIRMLENDLNVPIVYKHIPREENAEADTLVKKALYS